MATSTRNTYTGLALILAAGLGAAVTPAKAADFSCHSASTAAERTICSHALLGALDERMAQIYGRLWAQYGLRDRLNLRSEQQRFLNFRDGCGRDARCIKGAYLDQIGVLDTKLAGVLDY